MYDLTLGQNGHFSQNYQLKNPFAFHAPCNQNKHPFGQCGYLNQVEPFEKPWFVVVWSIHSCTHPIEVMKNIDS